MVVEGLKMKIEVTTEPEKDDIQDVLNGLIKYNRSILGNEIKNTELACFSYKDNGEKSGGIVGRVQGNWLLIKYLWVDETLKGQGIGSELITQMEKSAVELGCEYSLVDTFSFQARPFYEKHGYECTFTLDNYLISHKRHYLVKEFPPQTE